MWQTISNISTIITCVLFVAYVIGHVWKIKISKHLLYEKFQIENISEEDEERLDNFIVLEDNGEIFSVSSPNGIRKIRVYNVNYNAEKGKFKKEKLLCERKNINVDEKVYFKTNIPCGIPNKYVEVEKCDYIIIRFVVGQSGKNGELVRVNHTCRMTWRSWIYYLCT